MKKQRKKSAEYRETKKRVAAALKAQLKAERKQRLKAARDAREQEKLAKVARKERLQRLKTARKEKAKREHERQKIAAEQKKLAAAHGKTREAQRGVFFQALVEGYAHELGKNLANLRIFDANDEHDFVKARRWIRVARNFIEDLSDRFGGHDMYIPIREIEPVQDQPGLFRDKRNPGRTMNIRDF
jgi:hypothetical protein